MNQDELKAKELLISLGYVVVERNSYEGLVADRERLLQKLRDCDAKVMQQK